MGDVDTGTAPMLLRTRDLTSAGWTDRHIRAAVGSGQLTRLRDGAFCVADTDASCAAAATLRGRLTCVSELRRRGIFVLDTSDRHVHIPGTASRLAKTRPHMAVHRRGLHRTPHPNAMSVEPFDAVLQAVLCQAPRAAIATIDSALHHGLLREDELDELFAALPRRLQRLRRFIDRRAESGVETFLRLMLRAIGCAFQPQVEIAGVGRVDFLVGDWLIIECDSRAHHSSWEQQLIDRRRDQEAAIRGFVTFRVVAADVMWRPDVVRASIEGILRVRRA